MAREFFGTSPLLALPILALVLFGVAFLALATRAALLGRRVVHQRAMLALGDDEIEIDGGRSDG